MGEAGHSKAEVTAIYLSQHDTGFNLFEALRCQAGSVEDVADVRQPVTVGESIHPLHTIRSVKE